MSGTPEEGGRVNQKRRTRNAIVAANVAGSKGSLDGATQSYTISANDQIEAAGAYGDVVGQNELSTFGHPFITFGSNYDTFGRNSDRNTDRQESQYLATFGDTLTWVIKNHNLKMGVDFVHNEGLDGFTAGRSNPRGSITYTGRNTNAFAPFLLRLRSRWLLFADTPGSRRHGPHAAD